ncbi:MAG: T9SS type A sorting domain-containing protein [Candidatus Margulisiibacteriota bacterium]
MSKSAALILIGATVGLLLTGCTAQTNTANPEMPNPYLAVTGTSEVVFNDLAATCTIEIYTLAGEPVRTITVTNGNGQAIWDLKNSAGNLLVSGTYDYVIKNIDSQKKGKVVIIR